MTGNGKVLAVVVNCHLKLMAWMTPEQKVTCFISPPDLFSNENAEADFA